MKISWQKVNPVQERLLHSILNIMGLYEYNVHFSK